MVAILSRGRWVKGSSLPSRTNFTNLHHLISWEMMILLCLQKINSAWQRLTHWGRVTHRCVSRLTIIGSDNGLSPGRRQAIIWTSVGILLTGPLGTNFSEILIEIHTFSFNKMHLKMSLENGGHLSRPQCVATLTCLIEEGNRIQWD